MTTFHVSAFLASVATGIALPLRLEVTASVLFSFGFAIIVLHDYARQPRWLRLPQSQPAARRPRARIQFRALPLASTVPAGVEIRPIIERLRERNRLAA